MGVHQFFKGWRRKTGCVTLIMACVFLTGWLRSGFMYDGIEIVSAKSKTIVSSMQGQLHGFYDWSDQARVNKREIRFPSFKLNPDAQVSRGPKYVGESTSHIVGDFHYECGDMRWGHYSDLVQTPGPPVLIHVIGVQAPYWSVAIPLTLLSAYLLLIKPRVAKPKKTVDPADSGRA